ncbi:MAG: hypothetical protein O2966_02885 [Proteobacteria bacterium]|nr:hypothetical protein [Pseudomonadota bacterium]
MIEENYYVYALQGANGCSPARQSVHECFPDELRKMIDQAFVRRSRPTAAKWRDVLRDYVVMVQVI